MNVESTPILPPRPNPGALDWPTAPGSAWPWVLAIAIGVVAVGLWIWARRRRRRPRPETAETMVAAPPAAETAGRDRVVAWSEAVRAALAIRFGPSWRAKTTEEIAAEAPAIDDQLGGGATALVGLLRDADLAKFADADEAAFAQRPDWEPWAAGFVAGARSTITGR